MAMISQMMLKSIFYFLSGSIRLSFTGLQVIFFGFNKLFILQNTWVNILHVISYANANPALNNIVNKIILISIVTHDG